MAPGSSAVSLHILLAEDNELNRLVATGVLTRRGHRVTLARNGREALELSARESFDLALMDVQMPEMDGLQATAAIRSREQQARLGSARRLPILALTAADSQASLQACLAAGMDGLLDKPLRPAQLWEAIERVQRAAPVAPLAAVAPTPDAPLDVTALLEQAGGDRALLVRLVEIFREQAAELGAPLGQAVASGDTRTTNEKAHALKSLIGHWGRGRAFQLAGRLEALGRDGDADGLPSVYDELVAALNRLEDQLTELTAHLGARREGAGA